MHDTTHPLAGKTVRLAETAQDPLRGLVVPGAEYRVEGWWDQLTGGSWMFAEGNFAALHYAQRSGLVGLPLDDEVVYGHIGDYGHLVHVRELGELVVPTPAIPAGEET